jgi:hypothetical protein
MCLVKAPACCAPQLLWCALYNHRKFIVIRYEGYGLIGGRGVVVRKGSFFLGGGGCNIDEAIGCIQTLKDTKGFHF